MAIGNGGHARGMHPDNRRNKMDLVAFLLLAYLAVYALLAAIERAIHRLDKKEK